MSLYQQCQRAAIATGLLLALAHTAQAAEPTLLNLSASAQRELANDQLNATLYVQDRQNQPALLADKLNRAINRAKADSSAFNKVTFSSGSQSTWPQYDRNGKIQAWQGRASIQLQSADFTAAAELISRLQAYMLLENVQFSIAQQTRKATEQALIPEAIRAMQEQAAAAGKALGKSSLNVRELSIGENQSSPPPMMYRAKATMASESAAEITTPEWQPGSSTIQLTVSGRIELQ